MSADYDHGRRDGLRLALAILAAEEEKWAPLLGESRSWRTNQDRAVRHKALQVAQRRVQTALGKLAPGESHAANAELAAALARLRSEEHTSELQSLMRISYAVFCLKKKKKQKRP